MSNIGFICEGPERKRTPGDDRIFDSRSGQPRLKRSLSDNLASPAEISTVVKFQHCAARVKASDPDSLNDFRCYVCSWKSGSTSRIPAAFARRAGGCEPQREYGATSIAVRNSDVAAEQPRDAAADREPQSITVRDTPVVGPHAEEFLKKLSRAARAEFRSPYL